MIYRVPVIDECVMTQKLFFQILDTSFPMLPIEAMNNYKKSWEIKKIEERITNNSDLLLLAWNDNQPAGLVSGTHPEGGVGTIIWLLVDEKYRGKNIGKELLKQALQYYRDHGCHKLKLTAPSKQAKDFYLAQGMKLEGFHENHWYKTDFWALGIEI